MRRLPKLSELWVALLTSLGVLVAYVAASPLGIVQQLEARLLDLRFQLQPSAPQSEAIVLVLIDDLSIREIGRWPWSRGVLAQLLARLRSAKPRTIAFDLLLTEAEQEAVPAAWLGELRGELQRTEQPGAPLDARSIDLMLSNLLRRASGDRQFAREIGAAGNVVLPFAFAFGPTTTAPSGQMPLPVPDYIRSSAYRIARGGVPAPVAPVATDLHAPIPELGRAAVALGHVSIPLEPDGAARFDYPVVGFGDAYFPSFPIEVARHRLALARQAVRLDFGQGIALGERFLPTDEAMRLVVNYRRPGHFPVVSAADVLAGRGTAEALADRIVLIGGAAAGVGDSFVTPFTTSMPGVERHANVIANILAGDFIRRRDAMLLLDFGIVAAGALLLGWLATRIGLIGTTLGFIALIAAAIGGNLLAFVRYGLWLNLLFPIVALALVYGAVGGFKYFVRQRQERVIRDAFKHYLNPELVEQLAVRPELLALGGEEKELTVLFADLRHSTKIAEVLPPARFVELLNDTFEVLTGVLFAHGGMLDKFTGDGFVAIFGAPLPQPDHAARACRAALDMLAALEPVQRRWAAPSLPPLEVGIGINTGRMLIGNMGSKARFSYTVIGDEANLGSRLEAANKDFGTRLLISEATWRQVGDEIAARELDVVSFRGLERPVRVFEIVGRQPLDPARAERLRRFEAALAAYRRCDWTNARAQFERLLAVAPDDRPTRLYVERCRARVAGSEGGGA